MPVLATSGAWETWGSLHRQLGSDGQDSMGAGAEEESLGISPAAQGLAVQGFLWLKTQG